MAANKKLLKRYIVELYEVIDEKVDLKEEVIPVIIKTKTESIQKDVVKNILQKRQKEIEDYFGGNLDVNRKQKIDKDHNKKFGV